MIIMDNTKIYLFDFDGTLVDTYESLDYVFKGAYASVGINITSDIVPQLMRTSLEAGYAFVGAPQDEKSRNTFAFHILKLLDDEHTLKLSKAYSEVKEVLYRLKGKGYRLGIVTSNNRSHVIDVLRFIDIDKDLFEVIVGNESVKNKKPNPDPVLVALEKLNASKEESCYIGDALDDMECGLKAGVKVILVDRYDEYKDTSYCKIKTLEELL